jgi:hypothetical protein
MQLEVVGIDGAFERGDVAVEEQRELEGVAGVFAKAAPRSATSTNKNRWGRRSTPAAGASRRAP